MSLVKIAKNQQNILYDSELIAEYSDILFLPQRLREQGALKETGLGRGGSYFVEWSGHRYVLRHYRRGGFAAKLLSDQYLWTGLKNTRAWREWHLLRVLIQQHLPVPKPAAVKVTRYGIIYKADIIMEAICDAEPVSTLLTTAQFRPDIWYAIGAMIKRFHMEGVYHADLNAHNILVDKYQQVYCIDFDKGEIRGPNDTWRRANLQRLKRSLDKLRRERKVFHYSDSDWQVLLEGYKEAPS